MSQPKWKCVANLGDVNPVDHGGFFVFIDTTGVYPPECVALHVPSEGEEAEYPNSYELGRFICEPCTFVGGVLSDNPFHPELPAWWADDIDSLCDMFDRDRDEWIAHICGDGTLEERAWCWKELFEMYGAANFGADCPPVTRGKAAMRIQPWLNQLKAKVKADGTF